MGINKVILVGNVGKDPEIKHLESGNTVANFPLATNETYKNKKKNYCKNGFSIIPNCKCCAFLHEAIPFLLNHPNQTVFREDYSSGVFRCLY